MGPIVFLYIRYTAFYELFCFLHMEQIVKVSQISESGNWCRYLGNSITIIYQTLVKN